MSEAKPAAKTRWGCCLLAGVGLVLFLFLMTIGIGGGLLDVGFSLLFGWISFVIFIFPNFIDIGNISLQSRHYITVFI